MALRSFSILAVDVFTCISFLTLALQEYTCFPSASTKHNLHASVGEHLDK